MVCLDTKKVVGHDMLDSALILSVYFPFEQGTVYYILSIRILNPPRRPAFLSLNGCGQRKILFSS